MFWVFLTVFLAALKVFGILDLTWGWVFTPLIGMVALLIVAVIYERIALYLESR